MPKTEAGQISPHLCSSLMSVKIDLHKKEALMGQKYIARTCPCLHSTTALRHVTVPRLSPLPQFLRNVVENKLGMAGTLHPENPLGVSSPIQQKNA